MVQLSKDNYVAIAKILVEASDWNELTEKFIAYFKSNNPKFSETLFRAYLATYEHSLIARGA